MQSDQRNARRKFMSAPAVLCNDTGVAIAGCTVLDVSETGMRVCLAKPAKLAGKVMLVLSKDGKVRRQGRVVWQAGRSVGLQFDRRYSGRPPSPERRARDVAWV